MLLDSITNYARAVVNASIQIHEYLVLNTTASSLHELREVKNFLPNVKSLTEL